MAERVPRETDDPWVAAVAFAIAEVHRVRRGGLTMTVIDGGTRGGVMGDDQRRWLRERRGGFLGRINEPWHLEGLVANAAGGPKLLGGACSTTFTEPDRLEWREPGDAPALPNRCPACQGAFARGEAVG